MTNLICQIVAALILTENSGPTAVGKHGDVGVLQIRPVMVAEANRLLGYQRFTVEDRYNPAVSRQIAFVVLSERLKRREAQKPFTSDSERIRYLAGIWNRGDSYYQRVKENML